MPSELGVLPRLSRWLFGDPEEMVPLTVFVPPPCDRCGEPAKFVHSVRDWAEYYFCYDCSDLHPSLPKKRIGGNRAE